MLKYQHGGKRIALRIPVSHNCYEREGHRGVERRLHVSTFRRFYFLQVNK